MRKWVIISLVCLLVFSAGCDMLKGPKGDKGDSGASPATLEGYCTSDVHIIYTGLNPYIQDFLVTVFVYDPTGAYIQLNIYAAGIQENKYYLLDATGHLYIFNCNGWWYKIIAYS